MPDHILKIGGYLSTIIDYVGYHDHRTTSSESTTTDDDLSSLEDLLNEGVGLSTDLRRQGNANDGRSSDGLVDASRDNSQVVQDVPVANKPSIDMPSIDMPVTDKPVTDNPVTDKPVTDKPVTDKPSETNIVLEEKKKVSLDSVDLMPGSDVRLSLTQSLIAAEEVEFMDRLHSLLADGASVEEILGSRQPSQDSWEEPTADQQVTVACCGDDTDTTDDNLETEGVQRTHRISTNCSICSNVMKAVHFHEELNVVHTISIESGNLLTPLPKKEPSTTNLTSSKHDKHKAKEESEKHREKKNKKHDKSSNKSDESKPTN